MMAKILWSFGSWLCLFCLEPSIAQVNTSLDSLAPISESISQPTSLTVSQTVTQESLMDLWWQYTKYHGQLEDEVQEEIAENLRMHIDQPKHLCAASMSDVFDAFYVHTASLLELQEASCSTQESESVIDSSFIKQVIDIAFVGEFMSSYVVWRSNTQTSMKPKKTYDIDGGLVSTVSFSTPIPQRGESLDSSSQWIGSPSRQKHRLQVRSTTIDLRLSLQKKPGESLGFIPWQSWLAGGLQVNLPASNLTLTLGQFRHLSPARLLSSGSSSPLRTPTYLTTLRPHRVSTSREPYRAMKGVSVSSAPSSTTQIRLSLSHRALDARLWQGDTLHPPTTSVNWTTRRGLKAQHRMTQTSLFFDGAAKLGPHRVSIAWNVHLHSDWVVQRDGFLWSTSPFHGVELGWSRRFSSPAPWQQNIVAFAAVALHHAPRANASPVDGIAMGGFHLTREKLRAKVSLGWASPSWLSPVGGTLTSLDEHVSRLTSHVDFDLHVQPLRLGLTHSITHHQQVLAQPLKQTLKVYAQWDLPANTKLRGTWSSRSIHEHNWTSSLPYTLTPEFTHIQRASLSAYVTVGQHNLRAGGRWIANAVIWKQPSTGWFLRVHSMFNAFQSTLQWSTWAPTASQPSIMLGQPTLRGATGLYSHTGQSSSLVGVVQLHQPLPSEMSLSLGVRAGVQQLFNRGFKGSGLESRPGTRHTWFDVHISLGF
ncbi:MAG: hypothetical protein RI519_01055 [Balneolaceae bacterium]|nr:hypothetical protein [Balneolaceae bacterium]